MKFQELVHRHDSNKEKETDKVMREYETNALEMLVRIFEDSVSQLFSLKTGKTDTDTEKTGAGNTQREAHEIHELVKKSLYALSSALRGNIDIQEFVLAMLPKVSLPDVTVDTDSLNALHVSLYRLISADSSLGVVPLDNITRKVWSLLADTLDEREEIRGELVQYIRQLDLAREQESATASAAGTNITAERDMQWKAQRDTIVTALNQLQLFGDSLISGLSSMDLNPFFANVTTRTLQSYFHRFQTLVTAKKTRTESTSTSEESMILDASVFETANVESTLRSLLSISKHLLRAVPPSLPSQSLSVNGEVAVDGVQSNVTWPQWQLSIRHSIEEMVRFRKVLENENDKSEMLERYEELFALVKDNAELLQMRQ
jgi:hypothetical protein